MKVVAASLIGVVILSFCAWGETPASKPANDDELFDPNRAATAEFVIRGLLEPYSKGTQFSTLTVSQVFKAPDGVKIEVGQKLKVEVCRKMNAPVTVYLSYDAFREKYRLSKPWWGGGFSHAASQPSTRPMDKKNVAEQIQRLSDKRYEVREEATKSLMEMGQAIVSHLETKMEDKELEAEASVRIQAVLQKLTSDVTDPDTGIRVTIEPNGEILARQGGVEIWRRNLQDWPVKSLKISGQCVIVSPNRIYIRLADGSIMSRGGSP